MVRTLEGIFRRPIQLLLLLILLPLVSVAVVYFVSPHDYQSTAALWALQRYAVISSTGPESDLTSTPAQTQTTALAELLQTRLFALNVAHQADITSTLRLSASTLANPQKLDNALFAEISQKVKVTPGTYNLYEVTYANIDPQASQRVVAFVVQDFATQSTGFSVYEGQQLLASYRTQLADAQHTANADSVSASQYIAAHSKLSQQQLASDPQYALIQARIQGDQATIQNIQTTITTINQQISTQGTTSASLFKVIDQPTAGITPQSRTKTYLLAGGISLGVALLSCVIYLVILVRRDRSIYTTLDLQKVTTFPLVMRCPRITTKAVPMLLGESVRFDAGWGESK